MKTLSPTKRQYTGAEIAEAIMVYDELKKCGGVNKGVLDLEKIAAGYGKDWHKDVDIQFHPLAATVEDLGGDQR